MIRPEDELFHERPGDDAGWNESGWFALSVPDRELSGFVYAHHRANRGYAWAGLGLWDPSAGQTHDCLHYDYTVRPLSPEEQAVGSPVFGFSLDPGLSAECVEPLGRYRFRYCGGCEADLVWTAVMEPIAPGLAEGWGGFGAGHFEQGGRMTGEIRIGGERIDVDCFSVRDRSWGPHRPIGLARGGYPWAVAGPDDAFQLQAVSELPPDADPIVGTTEAVKTGWYRRDGRYGSVESGERTVERAEDGRPLVVTVRARDDLDRELTAIGRCVNWLQFSFADMYWWWCLTDWEFDGLRAWGEEIDFYGAPAYRRFARSLRAPARAEPLAVSGAPDRGGASERRRPWRSST